jgi:hypothetical protein
MRTPDETAGREMTYITLSGERRPDWTTRFRHVQQGAVNAW